MAAAAVSSVSVAFSRTSGTRRHRSPPEGLPVSSLSAGRASVWGGSSLYFLFLSCVPLTCGPLCLPAHLLLDIWGVPQSHLVGHYRTVFAGVCCPFVSEHPGTGLLGHLCLTLEASATRLSEVVPSFHQERRPSPVPPPPRQHLAVRFCHFRPSSR